MLMFAVTPLATILPSDVNVTYAVGQSASIECVDSGGPDNTFQWRVNGSAIAGETSHLLPLPNVQISTGAVYTCNVTNEAGSSETSTFLFISLVFITQPMSVTLDNGTLHTFVCEADGFPSPTYEWIRVDGEPIRDDIRRVVNMLMFEPVLYGDEGDYYCNASSADTTVTSQVVTLTSKCCV